MDPGITNVTLNRTAISTHIFRANWTDIGNLSTEQFKYRQG